MKIEILVLLLFITFLLIPVCAGSDDYMIDGNTVYIDNENVYMSATPHTIASSGWVYFNLTSKQYSGDINVAWGFNTSVSKPTKAELYAPHWVNTTSEHSYTFYNVSHFEVYEGDDLDYGNPYNTFQYAVTHEVPISNGILMEIEGYEQKISIVSFDSQIQDGDNRIAYWHTRHDQFKLWKDKTSTFSSITHDYQGYNKWYYIKDVNVNTGQEYLLRAWVEVPISLTPQAGKFYQAVWPSIQTIPQAIAAGNFYALDPWWNSSWAHYKQIYINQSMVNQLIGTGKYPLLVSITDSHLAANTREDGHDIVFTDSANTTQLDHELKWNKTTGVLVAWVGVDDVKNVSSINMYYGNPDATNTQNPAGVWDANFDMVQHLNETPPGTVYDSTSNNNDGTTVGMDAADQVDGQIDGSLDFDGADHISLASPVVGNNEAFTISGWVNGTAGGMFYAEGYSGNSNWALFLGIDDAPPYSARFYIKENNVWKAITIGTTPINDGMHYIRISQENKSYRTIYVDEVPEAINTDTVGDMSTLNTAHIGVLERSTFAGYLVGIADEVRISDSSRSAAWSETVYNNSKYPELFISLGAEQFKVPTITLVSFTPSPLNTNYTGQITISYMVDSTGPLNLSSLAFLYGLNYTIPAGGDMYNYISAPSNDIAYDGIYRAPHRNLTPYLSWEDNATITEGNVWKWGGYDNDSTEVSISAINATHTYINVTGYTTDVLPSSFYISKTAMYDAPKTGFEVSRAQGLIFKMWNLEEIRNRDADYLANMYFDTSWESTEPTHPVEIGYCNYSFNPDTDDIDVSPYCAKFGEWNGTRWVDHSFDPGINASYASPLTINASQVTDPIPTDINYVWLRSNTLSSKSFILNATNYDPGITNISFAQTETFWTYNELNGVTTAQAYTPSFFTTFARNDEELLHHLYIADDTGEWGHSEIFSEAIGVSSVPVSAISFEHFCLILDGEHINDTDMDATYNDGTLTFNIHAPADPDGGSVDHNITLHYANNDSVVAVINDTLTTTGDEYVDVSFSTASHYSGSNYYTMRCVSTDDEGSVATKWLLSDFTLDADGNTGWISNGAVNFWGFNDIPSLYTTISNNSLLSYNAGDGIYTMHIPFFKSKYNDTFTFDETVHLKSLNNEDVSYFRFIGETIFNNANIYGWNTTIDSPAPITDEYRAYVYSSLITSGNIDNSNFSYLGSDLYRQEGLNFVGTTTAYTINNTVFSHNAEGPIMEECANFVISKCTISDNVNVGVGVYFSDNFIIEDNAISSNGGRGVTLYEADDNVIRYNDITDSGVHGIHFWSNSNNNTALGNDITGSALYDYYLSSSSIDNFIVDSEALTDKIRVTGTSSVNIENTDNMAFSEDSLETSYAYPANFSMYVTGTSQTFDITQRDMSIFPTTDRVKISNLEWNSRVTLDSDSDIAINPTWFNITNGAWADSEVLVYRDSILYDNRSAESNGSISYYYEETFLGAPHFEFRTTSIPTPLLFNMFVLLVILTVGFTGYSVLINDTTNFTHIIAGFLSSILWIILGYQSYIGIGFEHTITDSVYSYGVLQWTEEIVEVTTYQYAWMGMLFIVIAVIMVLYSIVQAYNANKDIIKQLEGEKNDQ